MEKKIAVQVKSGAGAKGIRWNRKWKGKERLEDTLLQASMADSPYSR